MTINFATYSRHDNAHCTPALCRVAYIVSRSEFVVLHLCDWLAAADADADADADNEVSGYAIIACGRDGKAKTTDTRTIASKARPHAVSQIDAGHWLSDSMRETILTVRDGGICGYCGKAGADTLDHILPESFRRADPAAYAAALAALGVPAGRYGGVPSPHDPRNVVAAHRSCNAAKGDSIDPDAVWFARSVRMARRPIDAAVRARIKARMVAEARAAGQDLGYISRIR